MPRFVHSVAAQIGVPAYREATLRAGEGQLPEGMVLAGDGQHGYVPCRGSSAKGARQEERFARAILCEPVDTSAGPQRAKILPGNAIVFGSRLIFHPSVAPDEHWTIHGQLSARGFLVLDK